jgi:hypothetical protein
MSREKWRALPWVLLVAALSIVLIVLGSRNLTHRSGNHSVVWPAEIVSFVCFFLDVGLLWYLYPLDA